jgi:hypothetical protein
MKKAHAGHTTPSFAFTVRKIMNPAVYELLRTKMKPRDTWHNVSLCRKQFMRGHYEKKRQNYLSLSLFGDFEKNDTNGF